VTTDAGIDEQAAAGSAVVPEESSSGRGWLTPLAAAIQFLTVVPPLVRRPFTPAELGRAVGYFPLVGLLIGAGLAGLDIALRRVFPVEVASVGLLAAWIVATGALHLDGYLDACDALWGGRTPDDRLRILRDERVGAYAVAGGVVLLLMKYATLSKIHERAAALLLAPMLGRWAISMGVLAYPYRRAEGLGRAMKDHAGWPQGVLSTFIALGGATAIGGASGLLAAGAAIFAGFFVARWAIGRIQGLTGDIYGAICELAETAVLLTWIACRTGSN
jgi:adenosylcobinamide-GDP ribazoletransferase